MSGSMSISQNLIISWTRIMDQESLIISNSVITGPWKIIKNYVTQMEGK